MPNHVTNIINADKAVLDALTGENGEVDFNSVIPMPDNIFRGNLGLKERTEHGANNWYDWSVNNWGTKWNAYSIQRVDDQTISFETAWAHPLPVIKALSQKFPDYVLTVDYADEDLGYNFGAYTMRNGETTNNFAAFEEGSTEALDFATEIKHGMTYAELRKEWEDEG